MQSLTLDEIEQVSGGLTFIRGPYGLIVLPGDDPVMQPSPGPVIPVYD